MDFNFDFGGTGGGLLYPSYGGARTSLGGNVYVLIEFL
jgi:hypothetical protein